MGTCTTQPFPGLLSYQHLITLQDKFFCASMTLNAGGFLCCSTEATELSSKLKAKWAGWHFLRRDMSACYTSLVYTGNFQEQFSFHVIFALQEVLEPVPVKRRLHWTTLPPVQWNATPSRVPNPCFPGEVLVLNGKAQSRIRIGIALKGG